MMEKFKKSNFYKELVKLGQELKPMSWGKRIDHLWTYYKEYLWVVAIFAVVMVVIITGTINASKEPLAMGMLVNAPIDQAGYDYLTVDYAAHLGAEGNQTVELEYTNFSSLEDPTSTEDNYTASMILLARVTSGDMDYIILDKFAMEYYITQGVYLDLREFFTPEELEELGSRVIYARQEDEAEEDRWAVAVDISDLPFIKENMGDKTQFYFALSGSTQRKEICRDMWNYLHAWKPES